MAHFGGCRDLEMLLAGMTHVALEAQALYPKKCCPDKWLSAEVPRAGSQGFPNWEARAPVLICKKLPQEQLVLTNFLVPKPSKLSMKAAQEHYQAILAT